MRDNSTIAWISAGAALGGGVVAGLLSGAYQHWRDWYDRPVLHLDFEGKDDANIVQVSYKQGEQAVDDIYVRARLRNTGRQVARGCVVYLAAIEEVHASGQLTPATFYDAMPLAWPLWEFAPRNIPTGVDFYVDLVRISKHINGWNFGVKQLFGSHGNLTRYRGTYRLHLVATADNASSARLKVDVKYEQDWNTLRAYNVS